MKRKLYIIIILTLILSSCSKFLETSPDQRAELDTPEKIAELITSAYPQANYIPFMEAASDNAGDKGAGRSSNDPLNMNPWKYMDIDSRDMDSPTFYWYQAYKAIAAANHALQAINKLGLNAQTKPLKGEALIARAYAHHMLIILFSKSYNPSTSDSDPGIPFVTEPEYEVLKKYERKTVQYVYEMIEKDIVEGIPLLDDSRLKVPKFHFTKSSAHAFAARFYLFKQDFKKSAEHAEASLGNDLKIYIRPINSPALIQMEYFTKQQWYTGPDNPSNLLVVEVPTIWGRTYPGNRYGMTFKIYNDLFLRGNITSGIYNYSFFGGSDLVLHTPKFKEHFVTSSVNSTYGIPYNMLPILTVDELLLNWVEALAELGQYDKAIGLLNDFISHKVVFDNYTTVYVPELHNLYPSKINVYYGSQDLRENIIKTALDFKRVEFIFEGLRWFDIVRKNIVVEHVSFDEKETYYLESNSLKRMFQLPPEVISSGIQPNPR